MKKLLFAVSFLVLLSACVSQKPLTQQVVVEYQGVPDDFITGQGTTIYPGTDIRYNRILVYDLLDGQRLVFAEDQYVTGIIIKKNSRITKEPIPTPLELHYDRMFHDFLAV